jgi:hypothetical protein
MALRKKTQLKAQPKARPRSHHYHVYVIELADTVWNEARFRRANPDYVLGKPFVYVGMTGIDPDVRFDKHKAGIQSNRYAREFGLRTLRPVCASCAARRSRTRNVTSRPASSSRPPK